MINILLDIVSFPHPHKATDAAEECLKYHNLFDKVLFITHNNVGNILAALKILKSQKKRPLLKPLNNMRCLAHIINLIVSKGIKKLSPKLSKIEKMVTKLHRSDKSLNEFRKKTRKNMTIPLPRSTR
ncbi:unnamed protein product [Gordionus sp. m RMFG-2023]